MFPCLVLSACQRICCAQIWCERQMSFEDRDCTVCIMAPHESMGWQTQLRASSAGLHAGAMREVQSLLDDSDPVQESGPSVIPVRLS